MTQRNSTGNKRAGVRQRPPTIYTRFAVAPQNTGRFTILTPKAGHSVGIIRITLMQLTDNTIDRFLELYFGEAAGIPNFDGPNLSPLAYQQFATLRVRSNLTVSSRTYSADDAPSGAKDEVFSGRWLSAPTIAHLIQVTYVLNP